jgi:hypothetical protein
MSDRLLNLLVELALFCVTGIFVFGVMTLLTK